MAISYKVKVRPSYPPALLMCGPESALSWGLACMMFTSAPFPPPGMPTKDALSVAEHPQRVRITAS